MRGQCHRSPTDAGQARKIGLRQQRCKNPQVRWRDVSLSDYREGVESHGEAAESQDQPDGSVEVASLDSTSVVGVFSLRSLVSVPATTAFLLALVYAIGAIARSAELNHAGVQVATAFPLIPIEQDLARGVQVAVQPSVVIDVLLLSASLALFVVADELRTHRQATRPKQNVDAERPERQRSNAVQIGLVASGLGILTYAVLSTPVQFGAAAVGGVAAGFVLFMALPSGRRFRPRVRFSPALVVISFAVGLGAASLCLELVDPAPLPSVSIETAGGGRTTGLLVTFADGTWYVAEPKHQLVAVDSRQVLRATILPGHRSHLRQESLVHLLGL